MMDEDEIHPQQQQQQHYTADVHCTTQEFQDAAGGTEQPRGRKNKNKSTILTMILLFTSCNVITNLQ